jgi:hypothetical protein
MSRGDSYSPERRTALILTGTGADGAYHAGVLRALQEAGIKIDIIAARGVGIAAAVLAAVDGASRLWDRKGLWRSTDVPHLYRWRWSVRVLLVLAGATAAALASPLLLFVLALLVYPAGFVLGLGGFEAGAGLIAVYTSVLHAAFAPSALPTWLPRLIALFVSAALLALVIGSAVAWHRAPLRRRTSGGLWWALVGAPLDASRAVAVFTGAIWDLLKGGSVLKMPDAADLSRRYTDLLAENIGQPGFRELLLLVHDLDARRDLVFGLVREPFRRALFPPPGAMGARKAEAFDLAGLSREHLVAVVRGGLTVPGLTEPELVAFPTDSFWRGEIHRLVDRPAGLARLFEEAAAAGAEQAIVVSAAPVVPGAHELRRPRLDPMGRLSELAMAQEAAALRDACQHVLHRFRSAYVIRPEHNPVGAFDLNGAYDERSDRTHSLIELMERGYEDAYREFIEPVVAVSGEQLPQALDYSEPRRGEQADVQERQRQRQVQNVAGRIERHDAE